MSAFNLNQINDLSMNSAKAYLTQYFIPLTNGQHGMLQSDGSYEILDEQVIRKVYFKRMSKELNKFYFEFSLEV